MVVTIAVALPSAQVSYSLTVFVWGAPPLEVNLVEVPPDVTALPPTFPVPPVDFSHRFDFFAHAHESLADLRERWRVRPIA